MEMTDSKLSRRQLLGAATAASLTGLAGCIDTTGTTPIPEVREDDRDAELPEDATECISIDGFERDPEAVSAKEDVAYQFHPNYTGASGYVEMCANCRFFCTGGSLGAEVGACTAVEGGIRSQDWCALWQPVEVLEERERQGSRGGHGRAGGEE